MNMSKATKEHNVIKRKANSDVEAGYVKNAEKRINSILDQVEKRKKGDRAEILAGSDYWIRNYTFQELIEHKDAQHNPRLWCVDRFFPKAIGGPLVVEEPMMQHQIELCEKKRPLIEALGVRYLVLLHTMSEVEDHEELDKCGQRLRAQ